MSEGQRNAIKIEQIIIASSKIVAPKIGALLDKILAKLESKLDKPHSS